jgi:histidine triad (HIT) family protein
MENCVFCQIIKRQLKGYIIHENDQIISFLSLENHPLVVSKDHIPNIYSLSAEIGNAVMLEIVKIANAVHKGLGCDGIYIAQANGASAYQNVFHIHFHIYPKWENKEINEKMYSKEKMVEIIKSEL